jgi:hypothetical protein
MPGGQSAAPNCRFDASVAVHSLRSGGVMSAMRQLRHARNVGTPSKLGVSYIVKCRQVRRHEVNIRQGLATHPASPKRYAAASRYRVLRVWRRRPPARSKQAQPKRNCTGASFQSRPGSGTNVEQDARSVDRELLRPPRQARGKLQETVPPEAHSAP